MELIEALGKKNRLPLLISGKKFLQSFWHSSDLVFEVSKIFGGINLDYARGVERNYVVAVNLP
jgi:hypothetical protein